MRSTATVCVEKGFKTGKDVRLTLKAPEEIVEVSGGISREIEVKDLSEFTVEQELLWAIDSRVVTPPNCETCVKLVMNEAMASSPFYLKVYYRGRVLAKLYNRTKGGSFHSTVQGELFDIVDWAIENKGLKGFNLKDERKGAFTEVSGRCNFKFGVEQKAHVTQRPLQLPEVRNLAISEP